MSIEALWAVQTSASNTYDNLENGGVVVLENERVFGGDEAVAVTGSYAFSNGALSGKLRMWTWNMAIAELAEAYGVRGPFTLDIEFRATSITNDRIAGHSWLIGHDDRKLALVMSRMADLP